MQLKSQSLSPGEALFLLESQFSIMKIFAYPQGLSLVFKCHQACYFRANDRSFSHLKTLYRIPFGPPANPGCRHLIHKCHFLSVPASPSLCQDTCMYRTLGGQLGHRGAPEVLALISRCPLIQFWVYFIWTLLAWNVAYNVKSLFSWNQIA